MTTNSATTVDAVVIGRNEGARLDTCLGSLAGQVRRLVYVDSGSTDESLAVARTRGAEVVELDPSQGFTAARARNAGLARLAGDAAEFVQFVDGDCEVRPGWVAAALGFMAAHPGAAVVCGRRRERFPEASVFNRLCDDEWDTPVGQAAACGGDALMRQAAVASVGGFRDDLIAGEEPELCIRLRQAGGEVWRIDAEMTLHDAAITRLSQWARRARRAGHAFAEGAALHGAAPERHWVSETRRAVLWGLLMPAGIVLAALVQPWSAAAALVYPAQVIRLALRFGATSRFAWEKALFLTLARFPEAVGVLGYWWTRLRRRKARLIEYR